MVKLIPYQSSFLDCFLEWRTQPLSVRHNPLQPMTREQVAQMLESEGSDLSEFARRDNYRWFVEFQGSPVGSVSLKGISRMMAYGEIGYGVGQAHHGKGIATAAVGLLVRMCFTESPLRKLLAYVHDTNAASCRVLSKVGFVQEGFLREHYIINGLAENEILFGLLKREWKPQGGSIGESITPRT